MRKHRTRRRDVACPRDYADGRRCHGKGIPLTHDRHGQYRYECDACGHRFTDSAVRSARQRRLWED
jgi:hypothetical protein